MYFMIRSQTIHCNANPILQAEEALEAAEVPVGCVFVRNGEAIAKARNRTNEWRNVRISVLRWLWPVTYIRGGYRPHSMRNSSLSTTSSRLSNCLRH
jgi:hypothetical protein